MLWTKSTTLRCSNILLMLPEHHTAHKTTRMPYEKYGQAIKSRWVYKLPIAKCFILCGLLNDYFIMAVDFTYYRETDRLFLLVCQLSVYGLVYISIWQCYIGKYP